VKKITGAGVSFFIFNNKSIGLILPDIIDIDKKIGKVSDQVKYPILNQ
jgi:hypothetical protein